jgi:hypothetical protein
MYNDQLLDGMDVYDVDGAKIGQIARYDAKLGYFETLGTWAGGTRYIPFSAIERLEPSGAHLNVTKSVVSLVYGHIPAVTPDLTPEGRLTGGGTVQSGYTGKNVPLDAGGLKVVKEHIHAGTPVLDADRKHLGRVDDYDFDSGYMRIEKEGLARKDIFLPVTTVSYLDDEGIHLSEGKDTLLNRFDRMPEIARAYFSR